MKITELDLKENGKKYFCKQANEVFEVEEGNLISSRKSFSIADLLKMDFEEIKETKNPYERVNNREKFYVVRERGGVGSFIDLNDHIDNNLFNSLNYFNNKNYAKYVAFKETLMRRMDKFAWENNAKVIDWHDSYQKYYITFDMDDNKLIVVWDCLYKSNNVYFTSKEIAAKAIEEFREDLMKLYTWKFDF